MNEWTQEQQQSGASTPTQTPLPNPAPLPPQPVVAAYPSYSGQAGSAPPGPPPSQEPVSKSLWNQRTDGMTLVAGFHFVVAAIFLLGTLIMMIPTGILGIVSVVEDPDAMIAMFIVGGIAILTLGLCLLYLAVGYGLWTLKPWGRVAAMALAVVSLFGFPIGTVTGGLTLWYLMQPDVTKKFEMQ
ncbi:MAG TPA: hypothetical protein P5121_01825 [Caldilineaceae bacterium]|nr:hypothetical protein [Caldilineaceae bacterium]